MSRTGLDFRLPASRRPPTWVRLRYVLMLIIAGLVVATILEGRRHNGDESDDGLAVEVEQEPGPRDRWPAGKLLALRADETQDLERWGTDPDASATDDVQAASGDESVESDEAGGEDPTSNSSRAEPRGESPIAPFSASGSGPQRIDERDVPLLLEGVRDKTRDLPPALYFHYLDKARQTDPERLNEQGRTDLTFADFYRTRDTDASPFRGELLTIRGRARRVAADQIGDNAYGLVDRYELWVFTEDSGQFPWVVVTTELPEGMPLGDEVNEQVVVSGYFLKLWAYRSTGNKLLSAPVLLGHAPTWIQPDLTEDRIGLGRTVLFVVGGIVALVVVLAGLFFLGDRRFRQGRAGRFADRTSTTPDAFRVPRELEPEHGSDPDEAQSPHEPWRASLQPDHDPHDEPNHHDGGPSLEDLDRPEDPPRIQL